MAYVKGKLQAELKDQQLSTKPMKTEEILSNLTQVFNATASVIQQCEPTMSKHFKTVHGVVALVSEVSISHLHCTTSPLWPRSYVNARLTFRYNLIFHDG